MTIQADCGHMAFDNDYTWIGDKTICNDCYQKIKQSDKPDGGADDRSLEA